MTGYFARLASRTGIGAAAPTSQRDTSRPLEIEDVATFVSQPEPPRAAAATSPEPATANPPSFAEPADAPPTTSLPDRFAMPDAPVSRTAEPEAGRPASQRRVIDEPRDAVSTPRITEFEPPADSSFAIAEPRRPEAEGVVETEIRLIQSPIAASAAPPRAQPPAADQTPHHRPLFEVAPPQPTERATATQPATIEQVVEAPATQARALPEFRPALEQPRFAAPHEAAPMQVTNAPAPPRSQVAPSMRIGSIQVDVHAAPALQQPQPAPLAPPPPRPLSLRRFYLREW